MLARFKVLYFDQITSHPVRKDKQTVRDVVQYRVQGGEQVSIVQIGAVIRVVFVAEPVSDVVMFSLF